MSLIIAPSKWGPGYFCIFCTDCNKRYTQIDMTKCHGCNSAFPKKLMAKREFLNNLQSIILY